MRYFFQFGRLLGFCFAGELLHSLLPLPVPASVYGLLLLLAALCSGIIRLEQVRETGLFLTGIFPLLFVPAAAGVMELWAELGAMLPQFWQALHQARSSALEVHLHWPLC